MSPMNLARVAVAFGAMPEPTAVAGTAHPEIHAALTAVEARRAAPERVSVAGRFVDCRTRCRSR